LKITLARRKGGSTLKFEVERDDEAADLKEAILSIAKTANEAAIVKAIETLGKRGYREVSTTATRSRTVFIVRKGAA
jgi:hypothetical protein